MNEYVVRSLSIPDNVLTLLSSNKIVSGAKDF